MGAEATPAEEGEEVGEEISGAAGEGVGEEGIGGEGEAGEAAGEAAAGALAEHKRMLAFATFRASTSEQYRLCFVSLERVLFPYIECGFRPASRHPFFWLMPMMMAADHVCLCGCHQQHVVCVATAVVRDMAVIV